MATIEGDVAGIGRTVGALRAARAQRRGGGGMSGSPARTATSPRAQVSPAGTRPQTRARDGALILGGDPTLRQAYEALASNLFVLNRATPLRTVLVTSSQPAEGKSTIAVNLALTLAVGARRTALVDADLRKPTIHDVLRLDGAHGLADVLAGRLAIGQVLQEVEVAAAAGEPSRALGVVPAGSAPLATIDAVRAAGVRLALAALLEEFEIVVIDSPPVLSVSDALVLGSLVDGVLLVVGTGEVRARDAAHVRDRIVQAGGRLLGTVLNRFDESQHGPGLLPYHSYYAAGRPGGR